MRKIELEKLLEKAVADALGVDLPVKSHRHTPAKLPRYALPKRTRTPVGAPPHHHVAEHA